MNGWSENFNGGRTESRFDLHDGYTAIFEHRENNDEDEDKPDLRHWEWRIESGNTQEVGVSIALKEAQQNVLELAKEEGGEGDL